MAETKTLEALMERAASWPEEAQAELVRFMIDTEAKHFGVYRLTDEERAAIRKGLDERPAKPLCERRKNRGIVQSLPPDGMRVRYTETASADLGDILSYLIERNPRAAQPSAKRSRQPSPALRRFRHRRRPPTSPPCAWRLLADFLI